MYKMKISVIAIFYNSEKYCKKCIDSILSQKGNFELEIIAVNDCSTDNTVQILNSYTDNRIKVIHHVHNQGISAARNTGLKHISGDCFYFIDGDDYLPPKSLSTLSTHFSPEIDWVQGGYAKCDESGEVINISNNRTNTYNSFQSICENFNELEFVYTHNRLIHSKWKHIKFPIGKAHEDRFWNISIFPHLTKISNVSDTTYNYVCHPQSFSNKSRASESYILDGIELLEKMRNLSKCWQTTADLFQITAIEKNLYLFPYNKNFRTSVINQLYLLPKVQLSTKGFPRYTNMIHYVIQKHYPDSIIHMISCIYRFYINTTKHPI